MSKSSSKKSESRRLLRVRRTFLFLQLLPLSPARTVVGGRVLLPLKRHAWRRRCVGVDVEGLVPAQLHGARALPPSTGRALLLGNPIDRGAQRTSPARSASWFALFCKMLFFSSFIKDSSARSCTSILTHGDNGC